jgi:hypothetical protein
MKDAGCTGNDSHLRVGAQAGAVKKMIKPRTVVIILGILGVMIVALAAYTIPHISTATLSVRIIIIVISLVILFFIMGLLFWMLKSGKK